ncbi:MAG: pre-tRNA nuclear export protein [Chrysothrix sp. TS-e1954]|nr:MAG: pre-tRNA nuclear export protein [Chrysothrix sp. TS-e1954]
MDAQCENAIEVAWNPSSDQALKQQAFDFLDRFRQDPSAWQTCLRLFTRDPRASDVVRHTALEIFNNALQTGQLSKQEGIQAKEPFMSYIHTVYTPTSTEDDTDSRAIQNKLAQTFTVLFITFYASEWQSFFTDLWEPAKRELEANHEEGPATDFYLRILSSVHDEIADQLINTSNEKQKHFTDLKDIVRARDAEKIALSWREILSRWESLDNDVVELCLKTMGRWVSWSEISLVANQETLEHLYRIATRQEAATTRFVDHSMRDASIEVFTEIVGKKMRPLEKIELIRFVNVDAVLGELIASPSLSEARGTPDYDTELAEAVAKLVNTVVLDVVRVLDNQVGQAQDPSNIHASQLLTSLTPKLLRFLSDEFDEVCSTVIPSLTEELTLFRKLGTPTGSLQQSYSDLLAPMLNAIVAKMRYDDTSSWGEEEEETDEAEFQELRKRLKIDQQIIATINEQLYMDTLGDLVQSTLDRINAGESGMNWRDLDLALVEMYLFGELAVRNSGLYQKKVPTTAASQRISSHPHPAIQLSYIEICVRYHSFFEQNPQYTPKVLEDLVRFVHSSHVKVKTRSWHDFLRFVRMIRSQLSTIAENIVSAISDLLVIRAEVTESSSSDDLSSSQKDSTEDTVFQSQLFLFEAVGSISSLTTVPVETQVKLARTILNPLMASIDDSKTAAVAGEERASLQIHHVIEATGTFARGFSDWVPGRPGIPVSDEVSVEFQKAAETILDILGRLKSSLLVRTAARFAFTRLIGVLGYKVLQQLPSWIDGLLVESSSKDEVVTFLRLLIQVIFGFKMQIYDVCDTLLGPLLHKVFACFSEPLNGTDDNIQLGEVRREYLNFLSSLLNNGLASVLVSSKNQGNFENVIVSIEHFAKDLKELSDGRLAVSVLNKMCDVWGGRSISPDAEATEPLLPGFDQFMITRFSPLTWSIMTDRQLSPKELQANRTIGELATLQQTVLAKTGSQYARYLRETELSNLGLQQGAINEYIHAMATMDMKTFRNFVQRFLQQGR